MAVALQMTEGIKNSVVLCSGGLWTAAVLTECALACMYFTSVCITVLVFSVVA